MTFQYTSVSLPTPLDSYQLSTLERSQDQCTISNVKNVRPVILDRSLKLTFAEHRLLRTVTVKVSWHINSDHTEHSIHMNSAKILAVERRWFER